MKVIFILLVGCNLIACSRNSNEFSRTKLGRFVDSIQNANSDYQGDHLFLDEKNTTIRKALNEFAVSDPSIFQEVTYLLNGLKKEKSGECYAEFQPVLTNKEHFDFTIIVPTNDSILKILKYNTVYKFADVRIYQPIKPLIRYSTVTTYAAGSNTTDTSEDIKEVVNTGILQADIIATNYTLMPQ